jgi:serine/threonine protein kinase
MKVQVTEVPPGDFPYPFSSERDPIDVILNDGVVPIRKRDKSVPLALADVLDKALAKEVKERYQTAAEMLEALRQAL